jgi:hypothetical protein
VQKSGGQRAAQSCYGTAMAYDPFDELFDTARRETAGIDLAPPQAVADNAAKGLALRKIFGRGGTEIGVGVAEGLVARGALDPKMVRRMVSFFARHEVDKRAANFGNDANPSAGYVAWLLWGGDEGRAWALEVKRQLANS